MASFFRQALIAAVVTLVPAIASAQVDDEGHFRLAAYLALGFGGDLDWNADSASDSASLDATIGFGARGELPIHDYFVVGGLFELLTIEAEGYFDNERESVFDIDVWAKARYPIEISNNLVLEPYVGIPFGLTLAVLNDLDGSGDSVWPGFNTGVLAGAMMIFDGHFGGFVEIGWRHHQAFHEENVPFFGDTSFKGVTNQFALHLGAAYQF